MEIRFDKGNKIDVLPNITFSRAGKVIFIYLAIYKYSATIQIGKYFI